MTSDRKCWARSEAVTTTRAYRGILLWEGEVECLLILSIVSNYHPLYVLKNMRDDTYGVMEDVGYRNAPASRNCSLQIWFPRQPSNVSIRRKCVQHFSFLHALNHLPSPLSLSLTHSFSIYLSLYLSIYLSYTF